MSIAQSMLNLTHSIWLHSTSCTSFLTSTMFTLQVMLCSIWIYRRGHNFMELILKPNKLLLRIFPIAWCLLRLEFTLETTMRRFLLHEGIIILIFSTIAKEISWVREHKCEIRSLSIFKDIRGFDVVIIKRSLSLFIVLVGIELGCWNDRFNPSRSFRLVIMHALSYYRLVLFPVSPYWIRMTVIASFEGCTFLWI